jgi:1,2-phenylacetyl-CoA epoxidase catalytic subunit
MTTETSQLIDSRFAQIMGQDGVLKLAEKGQSFFSRARGPDELAHLFAIFRVGEHHAVVTIGDWLKSTPDLEVKDGYARLIWDEARHTRIWTQRMTELVGEDLVRRDYPDPTQVSAPTTEYFRLWDEYAKADCLPKRLAYIYVVDAWAGFAYTAYLNHIDPVTKWHLQTILADEQFHVAFGQKMAEKYVTSPSDQELLAREEEKIAAILRNVTDGLIQSGV